MIILLFGYFGVKLIGIIMTLLGIEDENKLQWLVPRIQYGIKQTITISIII